MLKILPVIFALFLLAGCLGNTSVKKDEYKKHFLGLSDNVTYFAEQIDGVPVSEFRYKVVFKPAVIVPDIELEVN